MGTPITSAMRLPRQDDEEERVSKIRRELSRGCSRVIQLTNMRVTAKQSGHDREKSDK